MARAETLGGAHAAGFLFGAVQQRVHSRLVVARRQQRAEHVERCGLGVFRHAVIAPGLAHQPFGIAAVAAREHGLCQHELALRRNRRVVREPRPHRAVVTAVVPQRSLDAPAQEGLRRPARIGRNERAVAFDRRAIVVAAQDQPFGELAGDRIRDRGLRLGGVCGLLLAHQLDDVFQRVLVGLRRRGRWRRPRPASLACAVAAGRHAGASRARELALRERGRPALRSAYGPPRAQRPARPAWGRRCARSAAVWAGELLARPRHPTGIPLRRPAPGSWPVRSIARLWRGKGSRCSSAAANHSIGPALGLFDRICGQNAKTSRLVLFAPSPRQNRGYCLTHAAGRPDLRKGAGTRR